MFQTEIDVRQSNYKPANILFHELLQCGYNDYPSAFALTIMGFYNLPPYDIGSELLVIRIAQV